VFFPESELLLVGDLLFGLIELTQAGAAGWKPVPQRIQLWAGILPAARG